MAEIMIVTGLLLYEPALAMARMVAHVALVPSLFLAATVFASVVHPSSAVSAVVSSPPLRPLLAAMVYAFLAGSTWPLVMPAHSVAHTHLVLMCFYAGFVPLSAWCFGVWGARVVAGST